MVFLPFFFFPCWIFCYFWVIFYNIGIITKYIFTQSTKPDSTLKLNNINTVQYTQYITAHKHFSHSLPLSLVFCFYTFKGERERVCVCVCLCEVVFRKERKSRER